ncbi:MAG: hypothetical protein HY982_00750 [Candidatus Magasanikbacteria bacterium]|nr:hypothetical protein [Candidatus Magasanikbacteria bacterium]
MLEHLFGSKTRLKLLRYFLNHPHEDFYMRELARRLAFPLNAVRRELERLAAARVIKGSERENTGASKETGEKKRKYFRLDKDGLITEELKNLLIKDRLSREKSLIESLKAAAGVEYLLLSGRFAGTSDSPTDVLAVGKIARHDLERLVKNFEKEAGEEIRYTLMKTSEFLFRRDVADKFLSDLLNKKYFVVVDKLGRGKAKIF